MLDLRSVRSVVAAEGSVTIEGERELVLITEEEDVAMTLLWVQAELERQRKEEEETKKAEEARKAEEAKAAKAAAKKSSKSSN